MHIARLILINLPSVAVPAALPSLVPVPLPLFKFKLFRCSDFDFRLFPGYWLK